MTEEVNFLVLGSGLSSLSFSALMAKKGRSVKILEAHEYFGGYGHTFEEGNYKFNAHLHYVTSCSEGELVDDFLKRLGLENTVTFNKLNSDYPTHHFEHMFNSIIEFIRQNDGELIPSEQVVKFILNGNTVKGVYTRSVDPKTGVTIGPLKKYFGKNIICNVDPKQAAKMIGIDKFSKGLRRKLDYEYSYSSFVFYGAVKDIDLRDYGFGNWNIWHCQRDHSRAFEAMYENNDYSKPYFAMNSNSLHTNDNSNCSLPGHQIFQILTFANYDYWNMLKVRDRRTYNERKKEVLSNLLDVVEDKYIPNIRDHIAFHMTGTPTTNERYVLAPRGGAYGVNLTPENFTFSNKLTSYTSLNNFYFCSAASGIAGFSGTIMTGIALYEKLAKDNIR